jgi:hypothetical protein
VADFINFLPVLAYDGSTMRQINAQGRAGYCHGRNIRHNCLPNGGSPPCLSMSTTTTLTRLMNNKEALEALMNIEGFAA